MKATMTLEDAVWVDPDRMSGAPCFRIDRRVAEAVLRAAGAELARRREDTSCHAHATST